MTFSSMIARAAGGKFHYTSQKKRIGVISVSKGTAQRVNHGWHKWEWGDGRVQGRKVAAYSQWGATDMRRKGQAESAGRKQGIGRILRFPA